MKKLHLLLIFGAIPFFLQNCATILSGSTQSVTIDSNPKGAQVYVDGVKYGKTPVSIALKKPGLGDKFAELRLDGYESRTILLNKSLDGKTFLNILLGGIIGLGVDMATGAINQYEPGTYNVDLDKLVSYNIEELETDENNNVIFPKSDSPYIVKDALNEAVIYVSQN